MTIIVNMACGLANRMFQYSYYLYLKKLGYDARIDYYTSAKLAHERVAWNDIFPKALYHKASIWDLMKTGGGDSLLSKLRRKYFNSMCQVKYLKAFEAPLPDKNGRSVYMMGVFQNAEVVESVDQLIQGVFSFRPFSDERNLSLMRDIQANNSVAIHVRKGMDYTRISYYKDTCPIEYYINAVEYIKNRIHNPKFYVFTDNVEWVEKNFTDFPYTLVKGNPVTGWGSHYDMQLMSLCSHNIISNSTYSWWGAYLNKNKEKIVILPEVWFNPDSCKEYTSQQIQCKEWIAL